MLNKKKKKKEKPSTLKLDFFFPLQANKNFKGPYVLQGEERKTEVGECMG